MDQARSERPARDQTPGADEVFQRRSHAFNHLDQIRAAYWDGHQLDDLSDQWGVSLRTIVTWVYRN